MEKKLFLLLLKNSFYEKNRLKIIQGFFPEKLEYLFLSLKSLHEKYLRDITIEELKEYYYVSNPSLTQASKEVFDLLFRELRNTEPPNEDISEELIDKLWKQEIGRQLAAQAIEVMNGAKYDFIEFTRILEEALKKTETEKRLQPVTTDIDELLYENENLVKWKFNIPELKEHVQGIGPGLLSVFFARPETGKTGLWVSLAAFGADSFCAQGAKISAIINEEPATRTQLRAIGARSGMSLYDMYRDRASARESYAAIKDKLKLIDCVGISTDEIEHYVKYERPDILIIDQLDKIYIDGSYARTDERLKAVYISVREIAKRYSCAVIGISQASAEAEGKAILTFDMMENSKTGKAAEADLIIGIGKTNTESGHDTHHRTLHVCKNKITGWHGLIHCMIQPHLSRYVS